MVSFKDHVLDIRKLTPKECWRLMGWGYRDVKQTWHDDVFKRAEEVCSNTQLYKQAGNGIVTNCVEAIGEKLAQHGIDELHLTELFGGIGCQRMGFENAGLTVISEGYVDFDKFAVKSYNAIWDEDYEPTDITKVKGEDLNA